MKKLFSLSFVAFMMAIIVSSCGGKNFEMSNAQKDLEGTWYYTMDQNEHGMQAHLKLAMQFDGTEPNSGKLFMEASFTMSAQGQSGSGWVTLGGTYSISGDRLTITGDPETVRFDVSAPGITPAMKEGLGKEMRKNLEREYSGTMTIEELTPTTLTISKHGHSITLTR